MQKNRVRKYKLKSGEVNEYVLEDEIHTVRVTDAVGEKLLSYAREYFDETGARISRADVVRMAILKYLREHEGGDYAPRPKFYDVGNPENYKVGVPIPPFMMKRIREFIRERCEKTGEKMTLKDFITKAIAEFLWRVQK